MTRQRLGVRALLSAALVILAGHAFPRSGLAQTPLGTAFTYQGRLTDGGSPANGSYDLEFKLFDAAVEGAQVGSTVTLTSVGVTGGLFTVSLDFGTGIFAGNRRWLQMGVRPGGMGGAFTTLLPRQELTAGPNAVFALAAASATTVAGLTCSDRQVVKWSGGVWTCGADVDTNSGGTVTGVGTGAGLTGGPITTSGTVSVATEGITSSLIAHGAVGIAQIDTSQVQARVAATCLLGQYLRGINSDGTVLCEPVLLPPPTIATVDDPANSVGTYTSIAIGNDDLPVISYYDFTAGALRVTHCGNATCTSGNTITTVASVTVGGHLSITVGTDGLPIISYRDNGAGTLRVAHCENAACTGASTITTVDNAGSVGYDTSIAVGADGVPIISHRDRAAGVLKVAKCGNAACTSGNTNTTVDVHLTTDPFDDTSIAIGGDGLPVISYRDATAYALKVAHCGDVACTSGNTLTTVDDPSVNQVGAFNSIAIGTDDLPIISYYDATAGASKVAKCVNAACTGTSTITTVDDPANSVGTYTSIAIGTDGLPVISYQDSTAGALKVSHCVNAACTGTSTITTVDDPANSVGTYTSIAIGTDGLPVISYQDSTAGALKVAKCGTRTCQ
jgi:hypothetical protein